MIQWVTSAAVPVQNAPTGTLTALLESGANQSSDEGTVIVAVQLHDAAGYVPAFVKAYTLGGLSSSSSACRRSVDPVTCDEFGRIV